MTPQEQFVNPAGSVWNPEPEESFDRLVRSVRGADRQLPAAIDAFIHLIAYIQYGRNISLVCFLAPDEQPSGTLCLMPTVADRLSLKTCVWSAKLNDLVGGYRPPVSQLGAIIVSDVCLEGKFLSKVAAELHLKYGIRPEAAVVYVKKSGIEELVLTDEGIVVPIFGVARSETHGPVGPSNIWTPPVGKEGPISLFRSSPAGTESIEPTKEGTSMPEITTQRKTETKRGEQRTLRLFAVPTLFYLFLVLAYIVLPENAAQQLKQIIGLFRFYHF